MHAGTLEVKPGMRLGVEGSVRVGEVLAYMLGNRQVPEPGGRD